MSEDRLFDALQSMRTEVAAVTAGISGLTEVVTTMHADWLS